MLDPAGEATRSAAARLGVEGVRSLRIGKAIELELEAPDKNTAQAQRATGASDAAISASKSHSSTRGERKRSDRQRRKFAHAPEAARLLGYAR